MVARNDATGERVLTTSDGTEYHLIFTLDALEAIETQLRMGPVTILQRCREMALAIGEIKLLLSAGIEGAKRRHSGRVTPAAAKSKELSRIVRDVGVLEVQAEIAMGLLLSHELGLSDRDDEDEADEEESESPKAGPTS